MCCKRGHQQNDIEQKISAVVCCECRVKGCKANELKRKTDQRKNSAPDNSKPQRKKFTPNEMKSDRKAEIQSC